MRVGQSKQALAPLMRSGLVSQEPIPSLKENLARVGIEKSARSGTIYRYIRESAVCRDAL